VDRGSTDGTMEILARCWNLTVLILSIATRRDDICRSGSASIAGRGCGDDFRLVVPLPI